MLNLISIQAFSNELLKIAGYRDVVNARNAATNLLKKRRPSQIPETITLDPVSTFGNALAKIKAKPQSWVV